MYAIDGICAVIILFKFVATNKLNIPITFNRKYESLIWNSLLIFQQLVLCNLLYL